MAVATDSAGHRYSQVDWGRDWALRLTFLPTEASQRRDEPAIRVDWFHNGKKVGPHSAQVPVAALGEVTDAVVELLRDS